jgi:hypothetical protein
LHEADQNPADQCAGERSEPAHNHDYKGYSQRFGAHERLDAPKRGDKDTRETGQRGAECEGRHEDAVDIDAKQADHFGAFRAGPQD